MDEILLIEKHGDITSLQLNRPAKANALSDALVRALQHAIDVATTDDTRVLTIQGTGNNFCAGFDLSSLETENDETLIKRLQRAETMLQALFHAPFATVALVRGGAYGAGFDLLMCCDYRIATHGALFRMPSWRMGIAIGTRRAVARIGPERAFELLRSARVVDTEHVNHANNVNGVNHASNVNEALTLQIITEFADSVTWPRLVDDIASEVAALPANGYARLKQIIVQDTRQKDMQDLLDSLRAEPLKPRMQSYLK